MLLHRIHLNPRCREARRDLADPYQLHSTLCRAFSLPEVKCPGNEFLWRLEPETDQSGFPRVLVQSRSAPEWGRVGVEGWLAGVDPAVDLRGRLQFDAIKAGQNFRFRLRANPCVCRAGKRQGLLILEEQEAWIARKGDQHGFGLPNLVSFDFSDSLQQRVDVRISQEQMLRGNRRAGSPITVFCVLYDGILSVTDPERFRNALEQGIGHGKVVGLGLLSVVPV